MKRLLAVLTAGLLIGACGPSPQNDPIYQALLANPPTEVPDEFLVDLRNGRSQCKTFNIKRADQYMICWFATGVTRSGRPAMTISYYGPSPINPPSPNQIISQGGLPLTNGPIPVQ